MDGSALTGKSATLAGLILIVVSGLKSLSPELFESHWGQRLLPLLPVLFGLLGGFLGAVDGPTASRLEQGFMAGLVAAMAYKTGKTTIAGSGVPPKS